jgi:hypothetical protein
LRTRIVAGGPQAVAVTVDRQVRLRVVGVAYGFVRCRTERRWVWGRFDETFRVEPTPGELTIVAWGCGGKASYSVAVSALHNLTRPAPPRVRRMPRLSVRAPRVVSLSTASIVRVAARET